MKSLFIIAVSSVLVLNSTTINAQNWSKVWNSKSDKKEVVKAEDLSDEEIEKILRGRTEDDGITSDFHQKNIRKIVFHDSKLAPQDVNASTTKKKFNINDPIYFTAFLPYSVRNHVLYEVDESGKKKMDFSYDYDGKDWEGSTHEPMYNDYGSTKIQFFLDGKEVDAGVYLNDIGFKSKKTVISHWVTADPKEMNVRKQWISLVQNLEPGEHNVKIVITGHKIPSGSTNMATIEPIATGTFILVKEVGEDFSPKYGVSWDDFKSGMNDPNLEARILEVIQEGGRNDKSDKEYQAVKIQSYDWTITRHAISGVITGRNINVYCKVKSPNGTCKVYGYVYRQDHDGSKFKSHLYFNGFSDFKTETIDCD